jgi:hypothetical protein
MFFIDDFGGNITDRLGTDFCRASITCGSFITTSVTLHQNLGPCSADGISIAGGGMLTLNCNGFKILGTGSGIGVLRSPRIHGSCYCKNCVIKGFAIGVSTAQCNGISNSCTANALTNNRVLNSKGDGFLFVSQFSKQLCNGKHCKKQWGLWVQ